MRIVLVSPSAPERTALHQLLIGEGHEVSAVATPEDGLDVASAVRPHAFIADAHATGLDGFTVVSALCQRGLQPRVILMCPRASHAFVKDGAICLTKPIELVQLRHYLGCEPMVERQVA